MIIQRKSTRPHSSVMNESHVCKRARKTTRDKSNARSHGVRTEAKQEAQSAVSIDSDLVQRATENDSAAWDQLYKICAPKLYPPAFAILRNREDAQDAVQDCWLRAYANLESFQGRSSFSTWLTRIVINSALMILRKKRNEHEASGHDLDQVEKDSLHLQLVESASNPEQIYRAEERKQFLDAAIAKLRPRLRTALQMGQLRERSLKDAARALGISLGAAKARVFHARAALRKSPLLKAIVQRKNELAA